MKKHISIIVVVIAALLALIFGSCSTDDDSNEVTEEWKTFQTKMVTKAMDAVTTTGTKMYTPLLSESGLGRIYYKPSDYITTNQTGDFVVGGPSAFAAKANRPIYESDVLLVRYEGWYYSLEEKKVIFKSTEINIYTGESENGNITETLAVNGSDVVDGLKTVLLDMEVEEERIVCIPHIMGNGVYGNSTGTVPGYTTLFYDVKILKNLTADAEK